MAGKHFHVYKCVQLRVIPFLLDSTYTVEEAVEKLGFGSFQLLVTVFSGLLWVSREGPFNNLPLDISDSSLLPLVPFIYLMKSNALYSDCLIKVMGCAFI